MIKSFFKIFKKPMKNMLNDISSNLDKNSDFYIKVLLILLAIYLLFKIIFFLRVFITHIICYYSDDKKIAINDAIETLRVGIFTYEVHNTMNKLQYQSYLAHNYKINTKEDKIKNDPAGILDNRQYRHYIRFIRAHCLYKRYYLIGTILWMTICFWFPCLFGFIYDAPSDFIDFLVESFLFICASSYTYPVMIPLSFFIAGIVHPFMLRILLFHSKWKPFYEPLLRKLGYEHNEKSNALAILTGSFLGRFM